MNHRAEHAVRKDAIVLSGTRSEGSNKIIRTIMMAAIVSAAALGLIAVSGLSPEPLIELSKSSFVGP